MSEALPRGLLTDYLVQRLRADLESLDPPVLVGDGLPPDAAGWTGAQPGKGDFVSSVTVRTLPSTPGSRDTLGVRTGSWIASYGLASTGAVRSQADNTADVMRDALLEVDHRDFSVPGWSCAALWFPSLSAVSVSTATDPPVFELDDTVHLQMERSRRS